ncbi:hypothetical protein PoB_006029800 [Plakobranchus ocellatus]|uniref:Uncharacterized protein n=1 Tax=Plakobranchus ocellatus TaxID=259542 RepID=A0AAV4CPH7_9GAST|nr:hypothetical protein PoB_006029800 [Plakobranchus ocellatus]
MAEMLVATPGHAPPRRTWLTKQALLRRFLCPHQRLGPMEGLEALDHFIVDWLYIKAKLFYAHSSSTSYLPLEKYI